LKIRFRKRDLANCLSLLGHPFVVLPLAITIALAPHLTPARLLFVVLVYMGLTILPLLLLIHRRVRSGHWSDRDVSDAGQRQHFYLWILLVLALSIPLFWLMRLPSALIIGTLVSLGLLGLGLLINLRSKISMHMMLGTYCAAIVGRVHLGFAFVALVLLFAVGWSRLFLGRHTLLEVTSGVFLGMVAGIGLVWLT
jgi:membrane-associated phospholipid phosphatase